MRTKKELIEHVNNLPRNGLGRSYDEQTKKEIIHYFYLTRKKGNHKGTDSTFAQAISMNPNSIARWKRDRTEEIKKYRPTRLKNTKIKRKVGKPLKVNSSTGSKSKIIGTNLSSMLGNIDKDDILQQMQMVEILDEAGYDENKLIEKLDIAAPSMDEWKQIKNALKLVEENFDIEVKPKTKG